jgi:RNA polymerase sigma-70 factor (ECF subfamily)
MIKALALTPATLPAMDEALPPGPSPAHSAPERSADAESSYELLARAREGDAQALETLCARYLPRMRMWVHGRLPAWARGAIDSQDLVQDTLARVVQKIRTFEPRHDGAFQAYVRQALLNRVRDEIRAAERRAPASPLDSNKPSQTPSPLEEAIGQEALERYEAALDRLRPEDKEAIFVRIEIGLSYAEVADVLGKPSVAAAHMAVSRALVRLAREMSRGRA